MSEARINRQIIDAIRESTSDDPLIQEFLLGLLNIEAEHSGHWRWKKPYQDKLKQFTNRSKDTDENQ